MNPFEIMKEWFLLQFPGLEDVVFIAGKTSRVFFFVMVLFGFIMARKMLQRLFASAETRAKLVHNNAYAVNQAFLFFGTALALAVPYAKVPSISMSLIDGIMVCLIVQALTMVFLRIFAGSLHKAMLEKSMTAALTLGLYSLGASIGTCGVLIAAL